MTYCCVEFEWYFADSITDRTTDSQRPRETTGEEWHLHKAEWRPKGSKNRHCNKRATFAKTANVAALCQYHLWAQRGAPESAWVSGRQGNQERLTHINTPKVNKVRYFGVGILSVVTHFSGRLWVGQNTLMRNKLGRGKGGGELNI